jgi:hypothetical protein
VTSIGQLGAIGDAHLAPVSTTEKPSRKPRTWEWEDVVVVEAKLFARANLARSGKRWMGTPFGMRWTCESFIPVGSLSSTAAG